MWLSQVGTYINHYCIIIPETNPSMCTQLGLLDLSHLPVQSKKESLEVSQASCCSTCYWQESLCTLIQLIYTISFGWNSHFVIGIKILSYHQHHRHHHRHHHHHHHHRCRHHHHHHHHCRHHHHHHPHHYHYHHHCCHHHHIAIITIIILIVIHAALDSADMRFSTVRSPRFWVSCYCKKWRSTVFIVRIHAR